MDPRAEISYDAEPNAVFAMLRDEAFRRAVCEATHALRYDVQTHSAGESVTIRTSGVLAAADVPSSMRRMVSDTIEVVQVERWGPGGVGGSRSATVSVEIPGKPVRVTGRAALEPAGTGSRHVLEGEVTASVPVVRRRVERAAADPGVDHGRSDHAEPFGWYICP